jgi:ankyrin repeat protein
MGKEMEFLDAIKAGKASSVKALLSEDPSLITARTPEGVSALLLSKYYGQQAVAETLLAQEAALDIYEAVVVGNRERVAQLLRATPDLLNAHAPDGFIPLSLAAFFGQLEILELLLDQDADPNIAAANPMRVKPLHSALAYRGSADVVYHMARRLIEHGADVNAVQEGGWTPLHQAAANNQLKVIDLLLAHGAKLDAVANDKTPLHMAIDHGAQEAAALLSRGSGQ